MTLKLRYIFIILLILTVSLFSQSDDRLEIVATDSTDMRQISTPDGPLIELINNVHLRQEKTEMFCEHVRWWKDKGELIIETDVRIYDEGKELFADFVYYYLDEKIYKAKGNVILKDSVRQINAEQIQYFKLLDKEIADGDVIMTDLENDLKIFSDHAEMDNEQEYGILTDNPVFIKLDSTGQEELKITGLKMELFKGGDKIVVTDSVNIEQKEANAKCGIAEFYRNENEIILKNDPYVWQKHDRLSGGVIHLFITENNKLAKTIIKEKAMVISRVDTTGIDTRENKLTGEQITMFFQDNELSEVVVEMKATSYYYVVEEDEDKGMNRIIGDKIIVQINNRKIVNIRIESSPQLSEGIFYPTGFEPDEKRKN